MPYTPVNIIITIVQIITFQKILFSRNYIVGLERKRTGVFVKSKTINKMKTIYVCKIYLKNFNFKCTHVTFQSPLKQTILSVQTYFAKIAYLCPFIVRVSFLNLSIDFRFGLPNTVRKYYLNTFNYLTNSNICRYT